MSSQVEINGVTFLPIKEAAKQVSYSRDYVARLAREQKIFATQIGRQWFVDPVSLKSFADVALLEQSVRKERLSHERKREQAIRQEVREHRTVVAKKLRRGHAQSLVMALLVLGFGLVTGAGVYTASQVMPQAAEVPNLARLGAVAPGLPESTGTVPEAEGFAMADAQATTLYTAVVEQPLFVNESETRAMSIGNTEGIMLLARDAKLGDAEAVEALFSDEVEVEFLEDSTGVVTYTYEDGSTAAYPFVSVPVGNTAATTTTKSTDL
jgi:excisionase family DNA binding protein